MNLSGWHEVCEGCGRIFTTPSGATNHKNACKKLLKRFTENLENIRAQKRRKLEELLPQEPTGPFTLPVELPSNDPPLPAAAHQVGFFPELSPSFLIFRQAGETSLHPPPVELPLNPPLPGLSQVGFLPHIHLPIAIYVCSSGGRDFHGTQRSQPIPSRA
jgi:hypothetical protein